MNWIQARKTWPNGNLQVEEEMIDSACTGTSGWSREMQVVALDRKVATP
jgi:hypothetical protein